MYNMKSYTIISGLIPTDMSSWKRSFELYGILTCTTLSVLHR